MSRHKNQQFNQQAMAALSAQQPPVPEGMTPAYFTELELNLIRKAFMAADNDRVLLDALRAAVGRAERPLPIRPVDGMTGVVPGAQGR